MDVLRERSAGLDVRRSVIVACFLLSTLGRQVTKVVKHFTATASELVAWLSGYGVTHVGMEGTGVYWMAAYAALETVSASPRSWPTLGTSKFLIARPT